MAYEFNKSIYRQHMLLPEQCEVSAIFRLNVGGGGAFQIAACMVCVKQ